MTAREDREKLRSSRENLSKFFYDLAKATFTAMVVGDVVTMFLKEDVTTTAVWLFVTGLVTTSLLLGTEFLNCKDMEALIMTLAGTGVVALVLNIWLSTKSGKKWLKSL